MTRTLALLLTALAAVPLFGCKHESDSPESSPRGERPLEVVPSGTLFVERGLEVTQLAAGGGYVVWTTKFEGVPRAEVRQMDLRTRRVRTLAQGNIALHGLASTREWVVYAFQRDSTVLLARSHSGSMTVVLSRHLIGSLDARGGRVAWAEMDGAEHRIIVREMTVGRQWVAAVLPRCEENRCYRIDAVSLSDEGVSFVRGAIGPHPSQVGRRAFAAARARLLSVPDDPQPDLIPSSTGPLFFTLGQRLLTWPFRQTVPERVAIPGGTATVAVLGYERGWWFVVRADGGASPLYARRDDGSQTPLAEPPSQSASAGGAFLLEAFDWSGRQAFSAWALHGVEHGGIEASTIRAGRALP